MVRITSRSEALGVDEDLLRLIDGEGEKAVPSGGDSEAMHSGAIVPVRSEAVGGEGNPPVEELVEGGGESSDAEVEIPVYSLFPSLLTREEFQRIRLTFGADYTKYRFFYSDDYQSMSSRWATIPVQHFEFGLRLPIDPFLADILLLLEIQPAHLHPNAIRTATCFAALCRRTGVEPSIYLFSLFYYPLKMVPNVVSFRPRRVRVQLFDSPPSKVDWRDKWVMVESSVGFPFMPEVNNFKLKNWPKPGKEPNPTEAERVLLEKVERELGLNLRSQKKVYSTWLLLEEGSLGWAGIGSSEERRRELGMEDGEEFSYWVLHPGRVFFPECVNCQGQSGNPECSPQGRPRIYCFCDFSKF